jgi:hypothetical protein
MTQSELFPDNSPAPRKTRVLICKRCGHDKQSHAFAGEEDDGLPRPTSFPWTLQAWERADKKMDWVKPWPFPSYYKVLRCYERLDDGELCDCPRYQARPSKSNSVPKNTACAVCRHAKRDHHRAGCDGCVCRKFVNPFASSRESQGQMFPEEP